MERNFNFLRVLSFILCLRTIHATGHDGYNMKKLETVYSWKSLQFAYPNESLRQQAINSGQSEVALIPLDVDVIHGKNELKVLVTIERMQGTLGSVPITLGVVTNQVAANGDPIIAPYPNWEWNQLGDCDHITSVFRIFVDDCDRLWVLDTGKVLTQQVCPPQLLAFSTQNDQLLSRYKVPLSQVDKRSVLTTPIVDVLSRENKCLDTFVYIADVGGIQLIVYDHKEKKSWNIRDKALFPYPNHGTHTVNGLSFDLMDGVFSGALSPPQANGDKILYFHALASVSESWVRTSFIRNFTASTSRTNPAPKNFKTFSKTRTSQASLEVMNKNGVLFYAMHHETSLGCWNSATHPNFGGDNLATLITDEEVLQFTSGMKIIRPKWGSEELWLMTIPLAEYANKVMNPNVTNMRILKGNIKELIRGTICDVPW